MPSEAIRRVQVQTFLFEDDGRIPNHPSWPLLYYPRAVVLEGPDPAARFEDLFHANGWGGSWRDGVYPFPHYHPAAHEVLGVYRGSARIRLGGEKGIVQELEPGDVVLIPAGVGHENVGSSGDFGVVGAYPPGQHPEILRGDPNERPRALEEIARAPRPATDPVYGSRGPVLDEWR